MVRAISKGVVLIPKQDNPFEYYGSKSIYYNPIGQGCVMSIFKTVTVIYGLVQIMKVYTSWMQTGRG